ncbi:MAG: DnaJ domain-containing protein [Bacteroidales bacterium]
MAKYNKWVFGALGWAFIGPIGGLFGFVLGAYFDYASQEKIRTNAEGATTPGDFRLSLLALLAAVMKVDRKNLKVELDFIKQVFNNTFGAQYTKHSMPLLKELLNKEIPVRDICFQVRTHMDHAARLELVNVLLSLCMVDQELHPAENELMKKISMWLGISDKDYQSMHSVHIPDTGWAYKILEVKPDASDDEVRKAYRRMAMKYHPDRVAHLGDDVAKSAGEKFKAVSKAWDEIKKERNIN